MATTLVIHHFITPFNLTPIENVLKLQKVWTRPRTHTRNRASIRQGTTAATSVLVNFNSRTSIGTIPIHLLGRVALGLVWTLRSGRWPLRSGNVEATSKHIDPSVSRALSAFSVMSIIGSHYSARYYHTANHEALFGRLIHQDVIMQFMMLHRASTTNIHGAMTLAHDCHRAHQTERSRYRARSQACARIVRAPHSMIDMLPLAHTVQEVSIPYA